MFKSWTRYNITTIAIIFVSIRSSISTVIQIAIIIIIINNKK